MNTSILILLLAIALTAAVSAVVAIHWHSRRTASKLNLMVEAVGNSDFSLRFGRGRLGDSAVNDAISDVADQIFVPFFATKSDGSGIGLSVSRQIMRLSHGNIDLVRAPDEAIATTFVLTFL